MTIRQGENIIAGGESLPSQTGNANNVLMTDGTEASWINTETVYPVIETYSSGSNWYRIYSDGWCEQGGSFTCSSAGQTLTFLKPFSNTNYVMTAAGGTNKFGTISFYTRTVTDCKCWISDDDTFNAGIINWEAKGYAS